MNNKLGQPVRVCVADDHPIITVALCNYLESDNFVVDFVCSTVAELQNIVSTQTGPLLVVTDYDFGGEDDGLRFLSRIKRIAPMTHLVVFSQIESRQIIHDIIDLGVDAFVSKSAGLDSLLDACKAVVKGKKYIDPQTNETLYGLNVMPLDHNGLTTEALFIRLSIREREVLRLFSKGFSIREIAEKVRRSPKTISAQKCAAMSKLGLNKDIDLIRLLEKHRW